MLNNRTVSISSARESQVQVLQKKNLFIKLDIIITKTNYIKFIKKNYTSFYIYKKKIHIYRI
jgi:hypothetical protein